MDSISSKLKLENKELIHIVAEVVLFFGLVFYFSSQNKKLEKHIEDISTCLEEQTTKCTELEEKLKKTEGRLNQLSQYCSQSLGELSNMMKDLQTKRVLAQVSELGNRAPVESLGRAKTLDRPQTLERDAVKPVSKTVSQPVIEPLPKVSFKKMLESDSESETSEDELLDQEISEELSELQKTQIK